MKLWTKYNVFTVRRVGFDFFSNKLFLYYKMIICTYYYDLFYLLNICVLTICFANKVRKQYFQDNLSFF